MKTNRRKKKTKKVKRVQRPVAQIGVGPVGYAKVLTELRNKIKNSQVKAALAVNKELILLYWYIGQKILKQQKHEGWGTKVIERLANDLRREFPDMKGFSSRNFKYMRALAKTYPDKSIVQQLVAQLPWGHNCVIMDKTKDKSEREFYIKKVIENGWSRIKGSSLHFTLYTNCLLS